MPPKAAGASTRRLWAPEAESRQLGHPQASTMLGKLYIKQGRYKDAEVLLEEGRKLGDREASPILGTLYMKQGRWQAAEEPLGYPWASTELGGPCSVMPQL